MGKRRRLSEVSLDSEYSGSDYELNVSRRAKKNRGLAQKTKNKNKRRNTTQPAGNPGLSDTNTIGGTSILHSISTHVIQSADSIQTALLQWYSGVHASRGMPWRKPYDPAQGSDERGQRAYEVWVSEIMLQQTQVATVIPYYIRWMERFPTIRHLATSSIDEVNALWKGLGYYSRASRLLEGAKKAMKQHAGKLPGNAADLEANIPGIGRYSAGAIASIAYGERVPVLDGNVHRLFSRFLALHAPPKSKATLDILWIAATDLVRTEDPHRSADFALDYEGDSMVNTRYAGDINQALIELGSTVCKVRDPGCGVCPLRPWCRALAVATPTAKARGDIPDIEDACTLCEPLEGGAGVMSYPMKVDRKKPREELDIVNIIEWRSGIENVNRWFLMVRRPEAGLLAGLYEFPTSANVSKTLSHSAQQKIPNTLFRELLQTTVSLDVQKGDSAALQMQFIKPVQDVVHIFSHIKKTYRPQWVILEGGISPPPLKPQTNWVKLDDVAHTNIGAGMSKVWNLTKQLWENA